MSQPQADGSHSFAQGANTSFLEILYQEYRRSPELVDPSWRRFFEGMDFAGANQTIATGTDGASAQGAQESAKVEAFINAYRRLGHLSADLNPLYPKTQVEADMTLAAHGLGAVDLQKAFYPANITGQQQMSLGEIQSFLLATYCGHIGADFRDINNIEIVTWLQEKMESCRNKPQVSPAVKKRVLNKLAEAEGFERFLQARYLGQKRFSCEGSDALIPLLDMLNDAAAKAGVEEITVGMAHRGRLNVLCNVLGKPFETMFKEFEGSDYNPFDIDGDVKYHMGFANEVKTLSGGKIRMYLAPNPSHLEIVNPVIEGFARCRQRLLGDHERSRVLPLLLHGDAAFIGQGVTAETLNLSELAAYKTGGTIHVITNNQIGFTTESHEGRSTVYASGVAKIISAPVLHVNADDPEACIWVAQLAVEYRQKFAKDIVIDLIGYRRHGHNETDEPSYTQPKMYKIIKDHDTTFELYGKQLISENLETAEGIKTLTAEVRAVLQKAHDTLRAAKVKPMDPPPPVLMQPSLVHVKSDRADIEQVIDTRVSAEKLAAYAKALSSLPHGFTIHPKLEKLVESRATMLTGDGAVDWSFAELLAFASLQAEGRHIRLSGQDCKRGTFSSRHAVFKDFENGSEYNIFSPLQKQGLAVDVINSPLSEMACLGFEFGYSIADQNSLVLWEAQFGDFFNGAQIIVDQFIAACEAKWKQMTGLVMLLPHGHEGMGPEHSSARPERFLQLSGSLNIQVVNATTPAQYFHLLRRQMHRAFRKPLIVMSPKSLLRRPEAVSKTIDFTDGSFREVLDDGSISDRKKVTELVMCSGKIYYDLLQKREKNADLRVRVPIVRMEQMYPFPKNQIAQLRRSYPALKRIIWTQEEPQNMGGWNFVEPRLKKYAECEVEYVGRKYSGTTAEGSLKAHSIEQDRIIHDALGLACKWEPKKA
jgi:2-oxoglutarate dehydrogenase E1 component